MQPVHSISLDALQEGRPRSGEQARAWCARLEAGAVLYFPETPLPIPAQDQDFLLGSSQTESTLHKNIAYKPAQDKLSGMDAQAEAAEARTIMSALNVDSLNLLSSAEWDEVIATYDARANEDIPF